MGEPVPVDRTTAVLSIHPQYVDRILDGTKTIEYRKRPLPSMVKTVLIWRTGRDGGVVGKFTIVRQVDGIVNDFLIQDFGGSMRTIKGSGIEAAALYDYAGHKGRLVGIYLSDVTSVARTERFGWSSGPQSFRFAPADWRTAIEVPW